MLVIDVLALSIMLYANGGPSLQMSMLYLVVVAAANILLPSGRSLVVVLLAVITVVWQQFFFALFESANVRNISGAILLAVSFLGVSLLTRQVVQRLRLVERLAIKQAQHVRQLQAINQRIVERMQSGVLVLDQQQHILLTNHAAQQLLHQPRLRAGQPLAALSPMLARAVQQTEHKGLDQFILPQDAQGQRQALGIQFIRMHTVDFPNLTLLMIEGLERVNQQAQQLKLASLGRLTASIAHEIRNPLATISQASELLQTNLSQPEDLALVQMIRKQSKRMNRIIEDVLQISRRNRAQSELIALDQWLPQALQEQFSDQIHRFDLQLQPNLHIQFDAEQLQQVLVNLVQNALHHGGKTDPEPTVRIVASADSTGRISLDVIDYGAGVSEQARSTLFEPFFTTEPNGTGLGLYLSRAICDAHGARLFHVPQPVGACFRVVFAQPSAT
ncbi:MAG: ATP-binding protein [Pseudomonadota bacterium]|nr:ATP-binding protein [Pseudomonadota bacterium]